MITVQDEIVLEARHLAELESLFATRYRPGAEARGLAWISSQVSPPVAITNGFVTLQQRWSVADTNAWWAMRAQSGSEDVAAFWASVDGLCQSRRRTYLHDTTEANLTAPAPAQAGIISRGHRETAQLRVREGGIPALQQVLLKHAGNLPRLEASELAQNMAPEYAAGHLTWDLLYPSAEAAASARTGEAWQSHIAPALATYCDAVHALTLETVGAGLREAQLTQGVKRTAFFRLLPGKENESAARFEGDLLTMPLHIEQIRNWRLSRARPAAWHSADAATWNWVWEQEFADLDGLLGPYMAHPHHWAHIDRWFDPESGAQAIDTRLSHAFSPLSASILGRELLQA